MNCAYSTTKKLKEQTFIQLRFRRYEYNPLFLKQANKQKETKQNKKLAVSTGFCQRRVTFDHFDTRDDRVLQL